ncbi:MAG TPA: hypothetical protein VED18_13700 [Candidatus Sulfotelmatobacter sp.]|nr:hypothetical protein [Candidatus Sulfotelmatobacter sp.]
MGKMPGWMTAWALVAAGAGWADAQTGLIPTPPGNVRVTVEFRQAGQSLQGGTIVQGTGPGGTFVQGGPRGTRGSAQVQLQETQRITRRNVGSFLLIQDGGEGSITVADQAAEVVWFQQYALGRNYITPGVVFRNVGTSFIVRPTILPNRRVRLRITPQLSYRSDTDSGTIELVEASTEVVVPSGQPISIGGSEGSAEVVRQFLLGYERANRASQVSIVLTAETP